MLLFLKKPITITALVVLVVLAGFFYFREGSAPTYEFIVAERGNLVQEVSVTGRVQAAEKVNLAFEKVGKIARVEVKVGDRVGQGRVLAVQENAVLVATLAEAEADVKVQLAKLDELKRGTRVEEIRVQEVKVANAKSALADAKKNLVDKINDAYTKSDDALRNKVDQLFIGPRTADPRLNFSIADSKLRSTLESGRFTIEVMLLSWRASLDTLTTASALTQYTDIAQANVSQVKTFLNDVALALSTLSSGITLSQASIDGYRTDVSTARTNVNTANVNLTTAEEKLSDALSGVALAEEELLLKRAGTIEEQVSAQEAKLEQVQAAVLSTEADLAKTVLRSPIQGIVTQQDAKVGEIVAANAVVISVISESQFEIEVNVPEADVAKISLGDRARVTLDAYGSDVVFEAVITEIDPAETVIEGIATYTTTLQFVEKDSRVKSGMTANTDIRTDERQGVIAVPRRAVITKDGARLVRIVEGVSIKEVPVVTGLRGSDGTIEIVSGIGEGDKVIIFIDADNN
jgi:multidrug efflux pump subunit AcrA (membrane-fusion protein)